MSCAYSAHTQDLAIAQALYHLFGSLGLAFAWRLFEWAFCPCHPPIKGQGLGHVWCTLGPWRLFHILLKLNYNGVVTKFCTRTLSFEETQPYY